MKGKRGQERRSKVDLLKEIARLESINDQLETEIIVFNELLCEVGFENGMTTAKEAALELIAQGL